MMNMITNTSSEPIPPLSLDELVKLLEKEPKLGDNAAAARYCVTTPEYARQIFVSGVSVPDEEPRIDVIKHDLGSIQIIEKPGQRAAAWLFSSATIVRAYLQGWITEEQLEQLSSEK